MNEAKRTKLWYTFQWTLLFWWTKMKLVPFFLLCFVLTFVYVYECERERERGNKSIANVTRCVVHSIDHITLDVLSAYLTVLLLNV